MPFRFDNKWLKTEGFRYMVEMCWNDLQIQGTTSFRLASKLKTLKNEIKIWTKEVGDKLKENTRAYINELAELDLREMEGHLCAAERERREAVKKELTHNMNLEAISWRQKVREKWLKDGERNTKYFHCLANYRRKCNFVEEIKIDGMVVSGNSEIREKVRDYFHQLYKEKKRCRPKLDNLDFKQLKAVSREEIEERFTEEEVYGCLMDCNGDKTPGPDRFNMKFVQEFWEVMDVFDKFH